MKDVFSIYFDKMLEIVVEMLQDPFWKDLISERGACGPVLDMFMNEFLGKCCLLCFPESRARDAANDDQCLAYLEDAGLSNAFFRAILKKDWQLADMCMWQALFMDSGAQAVYDAFAYDVD